MHAEIDCGGKLFSIMDLTYRPSVCWKKEFYCVSEGKLAGQWALTFKVGKHLYTEAYNTVQLLT